MAHHITLNGDVLYCTKCGANSISSQHLLDQMCNSTLHEEELENIKLMNIEKSKVDIEKSKLDIEKSKVDIENKKLTIYFFGIVLAIISILGFFSLTYIGFDKIAIALQNMIVIAKSAYEECSKGGWPRLIKSLFQ